MVAVLTAITASSRRRCSSACAFTCWCRWRPGGMPRGFAPCVRALHQAARWNMIEVFTLGALLSLVRLAALADAAPGPGLFALGAIDAAVRGDRVGRTEAPVVAGPMSDRPRPPSDPGLPPLLGCESCGLVSRDALAGDRPRAPGPALPALRPCAACTEAVQRAAHLGLRHRRGGALRPGQRAAGDDHRPDAEARGAHAHRRHPQLWVDGSWGLVGHRLHRQHRRAGAEDRRARSARLERRAMRRPGAGSSGPGCTG